LPAWSGKFFSVSVALLGRTVLHRILKFILMMAAKIEAGA
jgi:hypothetical protein